MANTALLLALAGHCWMRLLNRIEGRHTTHE